MRSFTLVSLAMFLIGCGGGGGSSRNLPPQITPIANVTISANITSTPISIEVSDQRVALAQINVTSADQDVVGDSGLTISGAGASRFLTITPAPDTLGSATISVVVTDPGGLTDETTFMVTVEPLLVSFSERIRDIFAAPESTTPQDVNALQFNNDVTDDLSDLLN